MDTVVEAASLETLWFKWPMERMFGFLKSKKVIEFKL